MTAHMWATPGRETPFAGRTFRFAVGTPDGASANSWVVVTSRSGNVYISGRDNFKECKVSLHQSGKWRFAQTEDAVATRPDLVPAGADRAVTKWDPPAGFPEKPVVAFQIQVPRAGLYLQPPAREGWKKSVVFIEPAENPELMTVVRICMVPAGSSFDYAGVDGGTVADLDLTDDLRVHVDVTFEDVENFTNWDALGEQIATSPEFAAIAAEYPDPVVLTHGYTANGARFLMALPLSTWHPAPE